MAGFWMGEETQERMDLWLTRALVLLSFAAHLTLALLAGIRRHRDSGVRRSLVWLAYHVTKIATPVALGKVFVDTVTADSEQQQMLAFWAPFLLLHLGRPDNITSYTLENKGLSLTHVAGLVLEIGGAMYGSYQQRFMRGDGALRAAFFIMLFFGSYKYVERAVALRRASFDNTRHSAGRKAVRHLTLQRDNDAFVDYQVGRTRYVPSYTGWKYASKLVEMEASLMYDRLYTKASVINTFGGYIIRVLSPLATATALFLFHSKDDQALESADRMVTYIMLVGTLVLDVTCVLRALGLTWTYAFLVDTAEDEEEKNQKKGRRRRSTLQANLRLPDRLKKAGRRAVRQSWYWLRRILVSLDPSRLSLRSGPSGHRLLPGSGVGQHNLLHECSTPPGGRREKMVSFFAGLGKKKIDVKDELLEVIWTCPLVEMDTIVGTIRELDDYMGSNDNYFSFEIILIVFHVATDIFLLCKPMSIKSEASAQYEKMIRVISDYMMFLLAERQHMVLKPGDAGIHYKKACHDLKKIWCEGTSSLQTTRETKLANILLDMDATQGSNWKASLLSDRNDSLALGADWALKLLHELDPANYGSGRHPMSVGYIRRLEDFVPIFTDEAQTYIKRYRGRGERSNLLDYVLKCILVSWVRLLTFTSVECNSDSHAKQLSCGGELLTIVWLMKQHDW